MNEILSITVNKQKVVAGAIWAALAMAICTSFFSWRMGLVLGVLYFLCGLVDLKSKNKIMCCALNILWCMGHIVLVYAGICIMGTQIHRDVAVIALNLVCIGLLCSFILFLTGKWNISVIFGTLIALLLSTANYYVYQFRGKEMLFSDLLSLGTAMNVAAQYDYTPGSTLVYAWLIWGIGLFSCLCLPQMPSCSKGRTRLAAGGLTALLLATLSYGSSNMVIETWDNMGSLVNGYCLNFYMSVCDSFLKKPQDYSFQNIDNLETEYSGSNPEINQAERPNIIVIMSEAYSDLGVLGDELKTNIPVTPYWDSLSENTVRGNALCSIYGGTTANSEFEFLTSLSMAYLPSNSVPYQQFVHEDMFSLAWVMEKYGYRCFATHPYLADGWSRPTIYPMLGLKESTFLEDYPQKDMVRCFVSDREMFGYVLDKVSSDQTDQPWFIFGITMQNHSSFSYTGENYTQTIELEGYSREYPLAEQYLSLLHESDSALEMFLTELEEHPENTIVLFFGDHFPRVEATFLEELHGGSFGTLDEQMLQYTVPFFIWANFDIPEQTVEYTSLNYLALYLLETAGLPLPEYYQFIADLRDVVPAMNAFGYYSLSAQSFISFEEATGEEREWLDKYAVLQYNSLVDTKNRSDLFFEHYCGE